jgi:hypothetical protein
MISAHFTNYATLETRNFLEASARTLTFAMADVLAGALLCEHSAWSEVKAKANPSNKIAAAEANVDRVAAQRWCEGLDHKLAYQIEALGKEARYEEDKLMLFGLADARTSHKPPAASTIISKL